MAMLDRLLDESKISVTDAASAFRHIIGNNEKPYSSAVKRLNNKFVDDWQKDMLEQKALDGKLQATRVGPMLEAYKTGTELSSYLEIKDMFTRLSTEQIAFWKSFFNKPIEEIHEFGHTTISLGWSLVVSEVRLNLLERKNAALYSKSSDPLYWIENFNCTDRMDAMMHPFGWSNEQFTDIADKVRTLLSTPVQLRR
jgi:hypothetical protein